MAHILAANSKGFIIGCMVWASRLVASWPPTPLIAWQATQPLATNSLRPRCGSMSGMRMLGMPGPLIRSVSIVMCPPGAGSAAGAGAACSSAGAWPWVFSP
jgi:hypothetical protein